MSAVGGGTVYLPDTPVVDEHVVLGEAMPAPGWPLNIHSNAYVASLVIKTGPGILYGLSIYNSKASAQFVQLFDYASAATPIPADGAIPVATFTVAATSNITLNWIPGRGFNTGIVFANSSTGPTKTIGSADCYIDAQYL